MKGTTMAIATELAVEAAREQKRRARQDADALRTEMTQLLGEVTDDLLRQDLMRVFHGYAAAQAEYAEAREVLSREGVMW
jgi:hypothetical protein